MVALSVSWPRVAKLDLASYSAQEVLQLDCGIAKFERNSGYNQADAPNTCSSQSILSIQCPALRPKKKTKTSQALALAHPLLLSNSRFILIFASGPNASLPRETLNGQAHRGYHSSFLERVFFAFPPRFCRVPYAFVVFLPGHWSVLSVLCTIPFCWTKTRQILC